MGPPSGATLFCALRTSTSSSRRRPGPSALALASLRASLRGARCGHLVQSFHSPSASDLLSLAWPRESRQREGHPKAVVSGLLSSDCAAGLRGFADSTSVCWQRTGRDPSRPPCGPFLRPPATAYGARLARILRARAESKAEANGQSALIRLRHLNSHRPWRSPCGQHSLRKTAVLPFGLPGGEGRAFCESAGFRLGDGSLFRFLRCSVARRTEVATLRTDRSRRLFS